jgi:nucleotide-binding universal stress UspA family protein
MRNVIIAIDARDVEVLFGRPADEIKSCCETNRINLVVMGMHRTASNDIGSTTLGMLQRSSCDVLTVRLARSR